MRAVLPALLLSLTLFAGCVSGPASDSTTEPHRDPAADYVRDLHSVAQMLPVAATSKDGTVLRGHVYVPDGEGPFATIIDLSPYWNSGEGRSDKQALTKDGRQTLSGLYQPFLDAGFAVALMALRGSGSSEGCFQMGSMLDWDDGYAIVEEIAAQPWSNGHVGMYGISYAGWSQYMTMASKPPHLSAILPVSGVIDFWSLITRNGAPISTTPVLTTEYQLKSAAGLYGDTGLLLVLAYSDYYNPDPTNVIPDPAPPSHFTCDEHAYNNPPNWQLATTGDRGPWFDERDYRDEIRANDIPVFVTNGMTDGEGHIQQFDGLWDMLPPGDRRMMLGQWGHLFPQMGGRDDFNELAVRYFEQYLYDAPGRLPMDLVEYEDDEGTWHNTTSWPPPGTTSRLHLSADSLVVDEADVTASTQTWQQTAQDATLSQCAPYEAIYMSPPAKETVRLAGNFLINFTLSSSLPDSNLGVFLFAVKGDQPCPGDSRELRKALTDLRHWENTGYGKDFPTNTPTQMRVRSLPFATSLEAGERLVLVFAGSSELTPDPRLPELSVHTGPQLLGTLDLPVVEGTLAWG